MERRMSGPLPATLPVPPVPIAQSANVRHRFALNDASDAYTGPFWTWEQWEHLIDMLALHGINVSSSVYGGRGRV